MGVDPSANPGFIPHNLKRSKPNDFEVYTTLNSVGAIHISADEKGDSIWWVHTIDLEMWINRNRAFITQNKDVGPPKGPARFASLFFFVYRCYQNSHCLLLDIPKPKFASHPICLGYLVVTQVGPIQSPFSQHSPSPAPLKPTTALKPTRSLCSAPPRKRWCRRCWKSCHQPRLKWAMNGGTQELDGLSGKIPFRNGWFRGMVYENPHLEYGWWFR